MIQLNVFRKLGTRIITRLVYGILCSAFAGVANSSSIVGDWKLAPEAGALGVGPSKGDTSWWASGEATVTERACLFDDIYRFGADGSFANVMGEQSWIEGWQGNDGDSCGALVAPHDGSNAATYVYDESAATITVNGLGAHIGLAKVYNGGELSSPADAVSSIIYEVSNVSCNNMTLYVDELSGGGYWQFLLIPSGDNDTDGDGVCDVLDPFPADSSESTDTDLDGIGNNADTDDDGDGVPDITDVFPLDASESIDSDSDGIGNNSDNDDDNDGVADHLDAFPLDHTETMDTDSDGIGNNQDTDDDGDGVNDNTDRFPLDPFETKDTDSDGVGDNTDIDADNDGVSNLVVVPVLNAGVVSARWWQPNGFELLTLGDEIYTKDWGGCVESNGGPLNLPNCDFMSWNFISTEVRSNVLEVSIAGNPLNSDVPSLSYAQLWIQIGTTYKFRGYDFSGLSRGFMQFDVKIVDDSSDYSGIPDSRQLDIGFKAGLLADQTISVSESNKWVTITVALQDFLDRGSPFDTSYLSRVSAPFRIGVSGSNKPMSLQIDNVNWISHLNGLDAENNLKDAFPYDASEWLDTDADGIGNNADEDDDNDGVLDQFDLFSLNPLESKDTDGDGIGDNADTDDDNDGYSDPEEVAEGTDPLDANSAPRGGLNLMLIKAALDIKKAKEEAEE